MIKLLFVDDDKYLLEIAQIFLENAGDYSVETALSAKIALNKLKSGTYDAVVSDYQMPEMNGIRFLEVLRPDYPTLPFIIFTGKGREEIVIEAFEKGADFYVQKGGEPRSQFAELTRKIDSAVGQRRAECRASVINRLYTVLSETNKAIVHIRDNEQLLAEVCRIIVDKGGFSRAWIGVPDKACQLVRPIVVYGNPGGFQDMDTRSPGFLPMDIPFITAPGRHEKFWICNDIGSDPRAESWSEAALRRGERSMAVFAFELNPKLELTLNVEARDTGFFDEPIIALLEEITGDLTFALKSIEDENERRFAEETMRLNYDLLKKSEAAHRLSEEKFRNLFDAMSEGVALHEMIFDDRGRPVDYIIEEVNPAFERETGIPLDKARGARARVLYKTDPAPYIDIYARVAETGSPESFSVFFAPMDRHFFVHCFSPRKGWFATIFSNINEKQNSEYTMRTLIRQMRLAITASRFDIMNRMSGMDLAIAELRAISKNPDEQALIDSIETGVKDVREKLVTNPANQSTLNRPEWHDVRRILARPHASHTSGLTIDLPFVEIFTDPLFGKVLTNLVENFPYRGEKSARIGVRGSETPDGFQFLWEESEKMTPEGNGKTCPIVADAENSRLALSLIGEILSVTGITIHQMHGPEKLLRFEILVPKGAYRIKDG